MRLENLYLMSLLATCVYCKAHGARRTKPGHKKHKTRMVAECCPSVTEIIQPQGGVSKSGRILELYRDPNSTQSFYQTSCTQGTEGKPCRYVRANSACVQRYSYTYALVREFESNAQWRLDYIRIRNGCTCEVTRGTGRKRKRQGRCRQGRKRLCIHNRRRSGYSTDGVEASTTHSLPKES
ncbi:hypothetical protein JTE90_019701 [Oedothorax gibbosus]|uniref:Spaetzle domain-containing protein n=1 Tax=Oedothorax gibbosus TaxID=931172 RepID=A0AAV6U4W8_9ARAC|nr:hypothetical protein JTE90_019701 [Oedothorax gibbosus]